MSRAEKRSGVVRCQRCLKYGHYTYECENEAAYRYRPSRTVMYKQNIQVQLDAQKPPEVKKSSAKANEPFLPDEPSSDSEDRNSKILVEQPLSEPHIEAVELKVVQQKVVEPKVVETKPVEPKPVEIKPVEPVEPVVIVPEKKPVPVILEKIQIQPSVASAQLINPAPKQVPKTLSAQKLSGKKVAHDKKSSSSSSSSSGSSSSSSSNDSSSESDKGSSSSSDIDSSEESVKKAKRKRSRSRDQGRKRTRR